MKKKRNKLKDQIFNGAFENAELTQTSKNALINSGLLIIGAYIFAKNLKK